MTAALSEYAQRGWSGFSIESVARAAEVGKSSMYLRWRSKEQLLVDSIIASTKQLSADVDTGSLYGDVMAWAVEVFEYFLDPVGWTTLRVWIDAKGGSAALSGIAERVTEPIASTASLICGRAVERKEIPGTVAAFDVAECLFGCVLMHLMNMPPDDLRHAKINTAQHVRPLMHILLTGMGATVPTEVARDQ
jgi:AcrR family transcriptional regulator